MEIVGSPLERLSEVTYSLDDKARDHYAVTYAGRSSFQSRHSDVITEWPGWLVVQLFIAPCANDAQSGMRGENWYVL